MTPSPRTVQAVVEIGLTVVALAGVAYTLMLFFPRKPRRG